jgi:hypothetical protein
VLRTVVQRKPFNAARRCKWSGLQRDVPASLKVGPHPSFQLRCGLEAVVDPPRMGGVLGR